MSQEYAARYVQEILVKSKGNVKHAETVVMELVKTDEELLYGLTRPYLGGIVAHAVQRASKKQPLPDMPMQEWEPKKVRPSEALHRNPQPTASTPTKKPQIKRSRKIASGQMDGLMAQLEKNIGSGDENSHQKTSTHQTSTRHMDAMRQIARGEFRRKPKD